MGTDIQKAGNIVRGTTPTIVFPFKIIDPAEITTAVFTMKQNGKIKVEKTLETSTLEENSLMWTVTQGESLNLSIGKPVFIHCDWVTSDGTRGHSWPAFMDVIDGGKEEVI